MMKRIMTRSEAEDRIREASEAFFAVVEELGIVLEVGQFDAAGEPFTADRVKSIRDGINAAASHKQSKNDTVISAF